jgi:capsular exopolysaccharide synthesis family protein
MDLAAHFRIIAQNWLRILLASVLAAAVVFAFSATRPPTYRASALLAVTPGVITGGQTQAQVSSYLAQTWARFADTPSVVRKALRDSGITPRPSLSEGIERISASQVGELGFLQVRATGPNRREALALTRATAQALVDFVAGKANAQLVADLVPIQLQRTQLLQQLEGLPPGDPRRAGVEASIDALNRAEAERRAQPKDDLAIVTGALAGRAPISPQPVRDAVLAFLVALVVFSELTVLRHYVGDRFSRSDDADDVGEVTGLPVLGRIPSGTGIEVVEAFRVLRTNLMVLEGAGKPRTVAVVSANAEAGKTFTACNLATSAAALDEKVVLIDADLRRPAVHDRLGLPRAPGLSSVLQGADLAAALRKVPDSPFLRVLPSGAPVHDASGVLGARAFRHVLDELRGVRLVVVDTPPAALFAEAMAVASQCDATIFVLDLRTSRRRQVRQTLETLERAGANVVGVVVNRAAVPRRSAYYEA